MLDKQQLQTYRDAAAAAKALGNFYKDFAGLTIGMQMLIGNDIPTLATAVADLCAEVERLQDKLKLTTVQRDLSRAAVKASCKVIKPRGDA